MKFHIFAINTCKSSMFASAMESRDEKDFLYFPYFYQKSKCLAVADFSPISQMTTDKTMRSFYRSLSPTKTQGNLSKKNL